MGKITVRDALRRGLEEALQEDEKVFIMGQEVAEYNGTYKVTQGLLEKFGPKRIIDTPITEHGFAGIGIGSAFLGLKPVVEFMTFNFSMQAIDQIINSAAKTLYMSGGMINCPIVFRGPNGAAARVGAQHSQCYASWYSHIPGLKVIAPYSAADHYHLIKAAIKDPNPVIFLENELLYGHMFEDDFSLGMQEIGKAKILKTGTDVTLVSFSLQMQNLLEAEKELAKEDISCEVIDLCSLRPFDAETIINSVKKTNRLVILQEGWGFASVGASIANIIGYEAFDYLDAPIITISGEDVPLPYAPSLEKACLPTAEKVIQKVKMIVTKREKCQ